MGASSISNSLCNRHRNNDNCLATSNWQLGAGGSDVVLAPHHTNPAPQADAALPHKRALGMEAGQDKLRDLNPQRLESTTKLQLHQQPPLVGMSQLSLSASEKFPNNVVWILLFAPVSFPTLW